MRHANWFGAALWFGLALPVLATLPADVPDGPPATANPLTVECTPANIVAVNIVPLAMHDENRKDLAIIGCVPGPTGADVMWGTVKTDASGGGIYVVTQVGAAQTITTTHVGHFVDVIYDRQYLWARKQLNTAGADATNLLVLVEPASGKYYQLTEKDLPGATGAMEICAIKPGQVLVARHINPVQGKDATMRLDVVTVGDRGVNVRNVLTTNPVETAPGDDSWKSENSYCQVTAMYKLAAADGGKPETAIFIARTGSKETTLRHPLVFNPDTMKVSVQATELLGYPAHQAVAIRDCGYQWRAVDDQHPTAICQHHMEDTPKIFTLPQGAIHPVFFDQRIDLVGQNAWWIGGSLAGEFTKLDCTLTPETGSAPFYSRVYGVMCLDHAKGCMVVPVFTAGSNSPAQFNLQQITQNGQAGGADGPYQPGIAPNWNAGNSPAGMTRDDIVPTTQR